MAKVSLLQNQWDRGIRRDKARSDMPPGTLWDAVDVILSYGAPIRQRGGWDYFSNDASAATASVNHLRGGIYATFANSAGTETSKNIAIGDDGTVFSVAEGSSTVLVSQTIPVRQNPVFHGGTAASAATAVYTGLVIIPNALGSTAPWKYNGTAISVLGGSPPHAQYAAVYKDYTVLGNGTVGSTYYPDRIWFSPEGDPDCAVSSVTAWDTTDSWIGFSQHVKGLASTRNALLVFHPSSISRVRGSIPPPDEDMIVDDGLFSAGIYDPFSIATHGDTVIWASEEGIHRSDGAILENLTARGGMTRYWLDLTADATDAWSFTAGVLRDTYFLCVINGTEFVDCFSINLQNLAWTRLSNIDATSFWSGQLNERADELYWSRRNAARVARLSSIFSVGDSDFRLDGDGDAVLPVVETQYYVGKEFGPKRIRRAFLSYELTDYDDDNPLCTMSYVLTPEETSYTDVVTLAENDAMVRSAFHIDKQAQGIAFKFERTADTDSGAGDFLLYAVELEAWPYEQSRRI